MSMSGAMSAAIAGLKTHMQALNVVGNNIANVNTYGYKAQRATFKESIYNTLSAGSEGTTNMGSTNPQQIGYGCSIGTIDLDMSTGDLSATGRDMDCAISGDGFFLVGPKDLDINSADNVKKLSLTRVGNFDFRDGYLTDGQGNVVYGFMTTTTDPSGTAATAPSTLAANGTVYASTDLVPIRLPMRDSTTGAAVYVGVNGDTADTTNGYAPGENIYPDGAGAATATQVDGFINYENLRIDANGKITCNNADTGDVVVVGYIALGTVDNANGVLHTTGPYYEAGDAAGSITVSTPNSVVTGALRNGKIMIADPTGGGGNVVDPTTQLLSKSTTGLMTSFLEGSGTDLATEFTNMILYQRGYQANTRIVTVTDSMLEELVNMKR